jgi:hypothetical protein
MSRSKITLQIRSPPLLMAPITPVRPSAQAVAKRVASFDAKRSRVVFDTKRQGAIARAGAVVRYCAPAHGRSGAHTRTRDGQLCPLLLA